MSSPTYSPPLALVKEQVADRDTLNLRIIGLFVILIASLIGVLSPILPGPLSSVLKGSAMWRLFSRSLCAGSLLGLAFMHVLADSFSNFSAVEEASTSQLTGYPWASFCAMLGFLISAIGENLLCASLPSQPSPLPHPSPGPSSSDDHLPSDQAVTFEPAEEICVASKAKFDREKKIRVAVYLAEIGCVHHSIIIGIDLGLMTTDYASTVVYVVALCFHQLIEGVGLGGLIEAGRFGMPYSLMAAVLYSITTPLGVAIGIGVSSVLDENSQEASIVKGVFDGISAGLLLYIGGTGLMVEDLRTLHENADVKNLRLTRVGMFASMLLGCGLMAVIGIWA